MRNGLASRWSDVIGAISGDAIGSVHEGAPAKAKDFPPARARFDVY
jgi:hypothetical protein